IKFYIPVIDWIAQYKENPNAETNFHFHFQYFNTASARQILRLIMLLKDIKGATKIYWHSDAGDTDMEASGDRFSKMSSAPFEFVSH
ncbi:MAG TPA: SiaC family regulatory phosphoprotein, partial [Bacteroidia bacterium]